LLSWCGIFRKLALCVGGDFQGCGRIFRLKDRGNQLMSTGDGCWCGVLRIGVAGGVFAGMGWKVDMRATGRSE
jgi:hypothetical protein